MEQFPNREKEEPLSERGVDGLQSDSELEQMDVDSVQAGTSGDLSNSIRRDGRPDNASQTITNIEEFKQSIELIKPMERKTAQAFLDRGIFLDFRWPSENETKDEANIRKKLNSAKLRSAQNRQYKNPVDQELLKKRRESDAERHRNFMNTQDENLRQERLDTNIEKCRHFGNPENPELNQSRHEAEVIRNRERNLPDRLERAAQTPEQAQERMQALGIKYSFNHVMNTLPVFV